MHKHSDNAAPTFLPDLLPSLLPLVVRATMPLSSREEDSARSVCVVYICMYIYIYLRCTRTGLDSIRARACMRACERAWTRERDRDRNREQERAQIGHGWSVRSSFQTTPSSPSPPPRFSATFHLSSFLCFARRPLLHIYVFLRPIACPVAPSLSLALARRVSICPALATAQPLCRPLALLSSIPIRLARSSTPLAPFRNY